MDREDNHSGENGSHKYFNADEFGILLKRIRNFRGYKHQSPVAFELSLSRQIFSLWELGKRLPNLKQLLALANFFRVEMQYFFLPGANPEDYDLAQEDSSPDTIVNEPNIYEKP